MPENPISESAEPKVVNAAAKPPGILPKNVQLWIMSGIALVMVLVIALSGDPAPREKSLPQRTQTVVDPNAQRIAEYQARIEEQAQRLADEQARLSQAKEALFGGAAGSSSEPSTTTANYPYQQPPTESVRTAEQVQRETPEPAVQQKDSLEAEQEKREYLALFSSNVALSYRKEDDPNGPSSQPASKEPPPTGNSVSNPQPVPQSPAKPDEGKSYRLFEGTVIEAVLTNRLNSSFSGPVNCMVTTAVYSHDRQQLLIPQGSRILGDVKRTESFGEQRVAVVFHRIVMPDGFSFNLDQFQGLNQIGETGLRDQVNHHYMEIFGVSVALGAIAGFSNYNTRVAADASGLDAYRQGFGTTLSQSAVRILDRYLNVLPTFVVREGHRIKVYLSGDLMVPAYADHRVPSDL